MKSSTELRQNPSLVFRNRERITVAPRISIVLPTRNRAPLLGGAIESCLSQTLTDLELIVVDDGSEDSTEAVVRSFDDPRVVYVPQDHGGLPVALNTGFRQSRGELLTWTSDDNRYHSNALTTMVSFLDSHPEVAIVYAGARAIDEVGRPTNVLPPPPPNMLNELNSLGNGCFLYRRKVYEVLGDYDPAWTLVEDYEYWLRARNLFTISAIDQILYDFRYHGESLSSTRLIEVKLKVIKLKTTYVWNLLSPSERRYKLGAEYLKLSDLVYERGRLRLALRLSVLSAFVNPFGWRVYKAILRALTPALLWRILRRLRMRPTHNSMRIMPQK